MLPPATCSNEKKIDQNSKAYSHPFGYRLCLYPFHSVYGAVAVLSFLDFFSHILPGLRSQPHAATFVAVGIL